MKNHLKLKEKIEQFIQKPSNQKAALKLFDQVKKELESGTIRAAEFKNGKWIVNSWVKSAILLGFKFGELTAIKEKNWSYFDKHTILPRSFSLADKIRLVPGGSLVRSGAYVAAGTIIMPPSYINIGAYIDTGCMIDSHALVGSCAQIGKNVHVSAASQIGGVLEPAGALPVIVEDNVFIGGNCGVYEGVIISSKAVLGSGVILTSSTPVFDATTGKFIKKTETSSLVIPKNAVVIAGSRPITKGPGAKEKIHIYCPVIIKYRDAKTDTAVVLENILR